MTFNQNIYAKISQFWEERKIESKNIAIFVCIKLNQLCIEDFQHKTNWTFSFIPPSDHRPTLDRGAGAQGHAGPGGQSQSVAILRTILINQNMFRSLNLKG